MKRYLIIYKGQVQGVGFRYTLSKLAEMYNLAGYCENLDNGDVICEVEGNEDNLNAFIKNSVQSRHYIVVDDYAIKEIEPQNDHYFNIRV